MSASSQAQKKGDVVLTCRGITKSFGRVQALRGADLRVSRGGIFGLVGPNGAGKTTLFSIICGFLLPDQGKVEVAGRIVDSANRLPSGLVATLPQDAQMMPSQSIGSQLAYYGRLVGMDSAKAKAEALRVLELVGLAEVYGRKAKTLSHGMYKRVGIAQAFIGQPELIILDEPTAGLDPHAARDIRSLLRNIRGTRTVFVSSHQLGEMEDLCHEIAIMNEGRIVRQDTVKALVGQAAEITFRLVGAPENSRFKGLRALDFVQEAKWNAETDRLQVTFDPKLKKADEAASELVSWLAGNAIAFVEMQVGKSLEDRFIEETK
jgi:ABC-2 type transport system ATP-binding protein